MERLFDTGAQSSFVCLYFRSLLSRIGYVSTLELGDRREGGTGQDRRAPRA